MKAKSLLGLLLLVFILSRVFVASPYYFISMDEGKYLGLAENFPRHLLFNQQVYLVHPPLFPYLIWVFTLILPDHIAGITISFIFAVGAFFLMAGIFRLLGKGSYWMIMALFVLIASPLHLPTSRLVYKDSMFFGLFLLGFYFFLQGLTKGSSSFFILAGVSGGACCLTSDLGVYLFPAFLLAYVFFRQPPVRFRHLLMAVLIMTSASGGWLLVRYTVFRNSIYYPAGVDGTLELVRNFSLRQLLTPRYFPETLSLFDFKFEPSHFRLHGNVYPLSPLLPLSPVVYTFFYGFIALVLIITIGSAISRRNFRNNPGFFFSLLLVLFTLPIVFHPEPRFLIPILLPIAYLFAEGVFFIAARFLPRGRAGAGVAWILTAVLVAGTGWHLWHHRELIFTLEKEVESARTAVFLSELPADGVMAQVGYPPELAYLTGKRVVALPLSPRQLDELVERYDIHYLVYGQHYWASFSERNAASIWCYPTIRHIRDNPQKYPLLRVVEENYRALAWPDRIFIHGITGAD